VGKDFIRLDSDGVGEFYCVSEDTLKGAGVADQTLVKTRA
jgi:hypothetical protein